MKHFEVNGRWRRADDASTDVAGILRFDEKKLELELIGTFREGWFPGGESYPVIRGVVGKNAYGSFVTLIDAFTTSQNVSMVGVTSEKITANLATMGDFHLPDDPVDFDRLILMFSYLRDWMGPGGIKVERTRTDGNLNYVATYTKPKDVEFTYGEKTLKVGFNFIGSEGRYHSSLNEDAAIVIQPVREITTAALVQDHIRTIQDLISFATDTPNASEEITFFGEKDGRGISPKLNLIYAPIFVLDNKKEWRQPNEMLFTFAECQAAGINIFQKWLDFAGKHREFCEVYFGYLYAKPVYADDRLTKVMSAFTHLCSKLGPAHERTAGFLGDVEAALRSRYTEEERGYLESLLPTGPEFESPLRLLEHLEANSDLMGQIIDDIPSFVQSLVDTIDFFERRLNRGRQSLDGSKLHYAAEKVRMLIKIIVLKELGFDQDSVRKFVERNRMFEHLKTV